MFKSPLSILVNNENEIFKIPISATKIFEFNHKKDDTRMIFHALQQKTNVVVCPKDMYVPVMMVFAYGLNEIKETKVMKIESRKSINIRKFEEFLGTDIAANLSQIHSVTGFQSTSFLHVVGKINTICVSCKVLETAIKVVEKFIQTVY